MANISQYLGAGSAGGGGTTGGGGSIPVNSYGTFFVNTNDSIIETSDGSIWLRTGDTISVTGTGLIDDAANYPEAHVSYGAQNETNLFSNNSSSSFSAGWNNGGLWLDRLNNELITLTEQQVTFGNINIRRWSVDDYSSIASVVTNDAIGVNPHGAASDGTTAFIPRSTSSTIALRGAMANGDAIAGVIPVSGTYPYTIDDANEILFTGSFTARSTRAKSLVWNGEYFWYGDTVSIQQFDANGAFIQEITTEGIVSAVDNDHFFSYNAADGGTITERRFSDGALTGISFAVSGNEGLNNRRVVSNVSSIFSKSGSFLSFGQPSSTIGRWDEYIASLGNSTALYSRGFGAVDGTIQTGEAYRLYLKIG